jgi:hypothetical protein
MCVCVCVCVCVLFVVCVVLLSTQTACAVLLRGASQSTHWHGTTLPSIPTPSRPPSLINHPPTHTHTQAMRLINEGVYFNAPDPARDEALPIHTACKAGNQAMVDTLIEMGAWRACVCVCVYAYTKSHWRPPGQTRSTAPPPDTKPHPNPQPARLPT